MLQIRKHWWLLLFTALYVVFSLVTYKIYGITSDEQTEYENGASLLKYLTTTPSSESLLNAYSDPGAYPFINSPVFSQYFRFHQAIVALVNVKNYYEHAHLINMFLALPIFFVVYFILYAEYKKQWAGLVGILFLILNARFFGAIPNNPKDIPFAIYYFVSLAAIYYLYKFKSVYPLILGILFGLAQSTRPVGFTLYIMLVAFLIFKEKSKVYKSIPAVLTIFLVSLAVSVIFWPYLGMNVFQNLVSYVSGGINFEFWNNFNIFFGQVLNSTQRPWNYVLVWTVITLPLIVLGFFIYGIYLAIINKKGFVLLVSSSLVINLLLFIILRPLIYNANRHFLFFYPLISFVAAYGFIEFFAKRSFKSFPSVAIILATVYTAATVFYLFPYQYIYFNEITGGISGVKNKFNVDYWKTGYKVGVEKIIRYKQIKGVTDLKVYPCTSSFAVFYYAKGEFEVVNSSKDADLILCDSDNVYIRNMDYKIVDTVRVGSTDILYIFAGE